MKHHKKKQVTVYLEGKLEDVIEHLRKVASDNKLTDPVLETVYSWEDHEVALIGWVPMTEKEIEVADRKERLRKEREDRQKAEAEERERREYLRLKRKFEAK